MKIMAIWISAILLAMFSVGPAHSLGMYGSSSCQARNALEAYCVSQGGCPSQGYCHFPDGSYCELRSFYNGTCPGSAYYEQAIWMSEAYSFLNGDRVFAYPYASYQYPSNYPYYLGQARYGSWL